MEKLYVFVFMSLLMSQPTKAPTVIAVDLPIHKHPPIEVVIEQENVSDFMKAIAFKESRGIHDTVNKYGMLGKYQFSRATLNGLGYDNISDTVFLQSEALQDEVMKELIKHNYKILHRQITKYNGCLIDSICVTESGILAAAHLAGPSNVKKWLRSNGKKTRTDGFGTSIETYMNKFANYKINI